MDKAILTLLEQLEEQAIGFKDVIAFIETNYRYTPAAFKNGIQQNAANENQGSAKVFYFGRLNKLSKAATLKLFAEHYTTVLKTPDENSHQNIRQFMANGWEGLTFEGVVLEPK